MLASGEKKLEMILGGIEKLQVEGKN